MPELESLLPDTGAGGDYDFGPDASVGGGSSDLSPEPAAAAAPEPTPAPEAPAAPAAPAAAPVAQPKSEYDVVDPVLDAPPPAAQPASAPAASATPAASAVDPSGLSPQQQMRANALGMTPQQLAAFKDPEMALLTAENIAWRTLAASRAQPAAPQAQQPAPIQPPRYDENLARQQYAELGVDDTFAAALVERDKQIHAAQMSGFQAQQALGEVRAWAQQTQNQLTHQQQLHQQDLITRDYEGFVSKQSPEIRQALADPQVKAQIFQEADVRCAGLHARGLQIPSFDQVFQAATSAVLGDKAQSIAREQVRREVAAHRDRAVSRPRGADAPKQQGDAAAGSFANDFFSRRGLAPLGTIHRDDV